MYALVTNGNTGFSIIPLPLSRLRRGDGGQFKPGTLSPSGHMLRNCITSICRRMEYRADVLVWFVYEIIVWSNWFVFPSTDPRSTP